MNAPSHSPDLFPWDIGPAVAELQELLCAHGFQLRVDGDFGWRTEVAVKNFQHQHGLRADGIVSAKTWEVLKAQVKACTRVLRLGHSGADVAELQGLLQVHGFPVHRDGIFAQETAEAIATFQQQHNLKADGVVDSKTWTALRGRTLPPTPQPQKHWLMDRKWW
ncbi:MAG: peptidoglycan-binding protein [Oculatellaceae cyanobacterium Prado106]|nr:peptidoglycan-binding protein [Oculatellaceae cyanobacterium Prado106]